MTKLSKQEKEAIRARLSKGRLPFITNADGRRLLAALDEAAAERDVLQADIDRYLETVEPMLDAVKDFLASEKLNEEKRLVTMTNHYSPEAAEKLRQDLTRAWEALLSAQPLSAEEGEILVSEVHPETGAVITVRKAQPSPEGQAEGQEE